jgi:hypothetical protein
MRHEIIENTYYIYDDKNKIIFSVELTDLTEFPNNQIVIRTEREVLACPIDFIKFSENA